RWVPASATRKGEITFWLDGQQVGPRVSYDPYVEVPPPAQPDAIQPFAWLDRHHLVLILGGAPDNPISVRHVVVWQKDASQNLRN
ncbi:MAG TPA: hypothetical protein VFF98_08645, partial [Novosphingobium sp.]|nr:hypothetical protein [Novosphingobium sp.]